MSFDIRLSRLVVAISMTGLFLVPSSVRPQSVPATVMEPAAAREPLPSVMGLERSNELDRILLRNGEELSGTVTNSELAIVLPYGRLVLPTARVAGIDLHVSGYDVHTLLSVNGDRLSGFLESPTLDVVLSTGAPVQLRLENLDGVVFAIRQGEREGLEAGQVFALESGDVITGRANFGSLSLATNDGVVALAQTALDVLEIRVDDRTLVLATARMLDGSIVEGVLSPAVLDVTMSVGGALQIHQSRVQTVYAQPGTSPEQLGLVAVNREYEGELTSDDPVMANGRLYDEYTFYAREGSAVAVDMAVDSFDNYLILISPSGQQWENDDWGSTRRSRIEQTADASGRWMVQATSLSGGRQGTYRLNIEVN